jgi:hypothetical protein
MIGTYLEPDKDAQRGRSSGYEKHVPRRVQTIVAWLLAMSAPPT